MLEVAVRLLVAAFGVDAAKAALIKEQIEAINVEDHVKMFKQTVDTIQRYQTITRYQQATIFQEAAAVQAHRSRIYLSAFLGVNLNTNDVEGC
jgi:hypothetical protein